MSKSSKTSNTSTEQTHLTQTPTNPSWIDSGLAGMGSMLSGFQGIDPYSLVAGPSALQNQAAGAAGNLSTSPLYGDAESLFKTAAGVGPSTYTPTIGGAQGYEARTGAANHYGATTGQAVAYDPTMATAARYDPTTGQAKTYDAATGQARAYDATTGQAKTYDASMVGENPQVQSQSLLDNLSAYMSPYTNDVVNTTLAGFDQNAGRTRASQMLDLANDSTFGGSGGSILRSLTEGELSRGRAQTEAQLRDSAFQTGANLSNQDAGRRQSASSENAYNTLQRLLANQSATNTASHDNTAAANNFGIANMNALNTAASDNTAAANNYGLANLGAINAASANNTAAQNNFGLANMDAINNAAQTNATNQNAINVSNQGAANTAAATNATAANNFGLANLDALNNASANNTAADNNYGLANLGAQNTALANNTLAANNFGLANLDAINKAGQFNAGQNDLAANRAISAGTGLGLLGQAQGSDQRANIDTQSQLGQILQQLTQNRATSPLTLAGALTSMYGGLPLNLLHGQTADGTTNSSSTGKTTVSDPMGTIAGILGAGGSLATGLGSMGLTFGKG